MHPVPASLVALLAPELMVLLLDQATDRLAVDLSELEWPKYDERPPIGCSKGKR
jgi:hypothetical protein